MMVATSTRRNGSLGGRNLAPSYVSHPLCNVRPMDGDSNDFAALLRVRHRYAPTGHVVERLSCPLCEVLPYSLDDFDVRHPFV